MKHKPREYTSASDINALIDNPSAWLLSYKYGYKSAASAVMQRGLDVEYCLVEAIKGNNDFDYESILWDAGEGMPMLQGQFSDENIPDVTFIYLCSRKTNPVVVFTTATDLRLSKVKPEFVQTIDLGEEREELLAGYEIINHHNNLPISKLRRYIPINTDHYRFSGYDDEILKQFKCNTLEPHNSEL